VLALLLFGPKKLPELARQLGKLMGEFRRASNEFRMQMEDELRLAEQEEHRKKIAALEAAAPVAPKLDSPEPEQACVAPVATAADEAAEIHIDAPNQDSTVQAEAAQVEAAAPLPIATSGDLSLMPPATGLPIARNGSRAGVDPAESELDSDLGPVFDAIPHKDDPERNHHHVASQEAYPHG
jgi:sec-independent protein translocase protein TatB